MKYLSLSDTEMDIMQLLWQENVALSRPEILAHLEGKEWNPNSIHQVLNSMMKKGVLKIDGIARCGKGYGRTYFPTMTREEYLARRAEEILPDMTPGQRLTAMVTALLSQGDIDAASVSAAETLLKEHHA